MSIFGKALIFGAALCGLFLTPAFSRTPVAAGSPYAQMMCRRMGANYNFTCPNEIATGKVEAVELAVQTGISSDELDRLIRSESHRFSNDGKVKPCLVAKLDFIDTKGLVVKAMTPSHQTLRPRSQNKWTWQMKGMKPGEYLLSITLSLCTDNSHGEPIATPIAFNRTITVVGDPIADSSRSGGVLMVGILLTLGGALVKGVLLVRSRRRDGKIVVQPGGSQKIFVSYSKHDRKKVEPIIAQLKEAGHQLWLDRHALEGASTWRAEIVEALTHSNSMIFFASSESYDSINVGKELSLAADGNLIIIPVLLETCDPRGAGKFVVAGLQRIDARNRTAREVASELSTLLGKQVGHSLKRSTERKSHSPVPL